MNLVRIGSFLKDLRKEKGITQEQLSEKLGVSSRTVSRWETGSNLPDLSILIELADLYNVDIRELIDGERKSENMEKETKDILMKVADYADQENKRLKKKMMNLTAGVLFLLCIVALLPNLGYQGRHYQNLADFTSGLTVAILLTNMLYLSGTLERIQKAKLRFFGKDKK